MNVEELEFCTAGAEDVDDILRILTVRMEWLAQRGLKQWNGYFDCYPRSYFEAGTARGDFYLLKERGVAVAVLALFERDGRWDDDPRYFYAHHLATLPGYPGAGAYMLRCAESLGRRRGKLGIRCDSDVHDARLSDYYEVLGYSALSVFREGAYEGMRRVKYFGSRDDIVRE
ncbi:MAG: hypothetical protein MR004_02325 [Clostridiales bacterium]|nr:hypothetical protein [Clostridiales bacterium]MDY4036148.1 hypothetical protein [Candidatus Pseudoscilispira sp.]